MFRVITGVDRWQDYFAPENMARIMGQAAPVAAPLVALPFDAAGRRQTSFAAIDVTPLRTGTGDYIRMGAGAEIGGRANDAEVQRAVNEAELVVNLDIFEMLVMNDSIREVLKKKGNIACKFVSGLFRPSRLINSPTPR